MGFFAGIQVKQKYILPWSNFFFIFFNMGEKKEGRSIMCTPTTQYW